MLFDQKLLWTLFDYHEDGYLINRVTRGRSAKAGKRTCKEVVKSYRQVRLFGKPYREHVLIWVWNYGYWPDYIDHIDHDILNNKIENLRSVTHKQNIRHGSGRQAGIYFNKSSGKYQVGIYIDNRKKHIGSFNSYDEALEARLKAEKDFWHG
jgi:hypothetical protein